MTDWEAADRWRRAYHEAGHALVLWLCTGRPPAVMTLRPGKAHGACTLGDPSLPWSDYPDVASQILLPRDTRKMAEVRICWYLAGDLAEVAALGREDGYDTDTPDEVAAALAATNLARLAPHYRDLLAKVEDEPLRSDQEQATEMAGVLACGDQEEANATLYLLGVVVRRLLARYVQLLDRVALALFEGTTLDAAGFMASIGQPTTLAQIAAGTTGQKEPHADPA